MADYATVAELTARLSTKRAAQLTTDSGLVPDDAKLLKALDGAEGELNSYLAQRFKTPIDIVIHTEAAPLLREASIDIAVYRVAKLRPPAPEGDKTCRDLAMKWVMDVGSGKAQLPDSTAPASTTAKNPVAVLTSQTRNASRSNMSGL